MKRKHRYPGVEEAEKQRDVALPPVEDEEGNSRLRTGGIPAQPD